MLRKKLQELNDSICTHFLVAFWLKPFKWFHVLCALLTEETSHIFPGSRVALRGNSVCSGHCTSSPFSVVLVTRDQRLFRRERRSSIQKQRSARSHVRNMRGHWRTLLLTRQPEEES